MRRTPLHLLVVGVVLTLALGGCGDDDADVSSDATDTSAAPGTSEPTDADGGGVGLAGHVYLSDSITEDGADRPLAGDQPIRLDFGADGTLGASGGCNSMSGGYEEDEGVLVVDDLAMTQMACEPAALMEQDDWLSAFLQSGPEVALDGASLTLTSDTVVMVLSEEAPPADAELTGVTWTLESIIEGEGPDSAVSSVPDGVVATLEFGEDGTVAVAAGCNTGSAGYTRTEDTLTVEPLALTRMACEEGPTTVEAAVTAVLDGEVAYVIDGDTLTITGVDGAGLGYRTDV
jgi:heat shock protein HslJ